jgi:purine-binding chemotaxis protein CheW
MTRQFCTFAVGGLYLGIAVERVQEVLRDIAVTPVPTAPPAVRGLINLRGRIVTALCLRTVFGLPPDETQRSPTMIVLDDGDETLALVVDRAGDVVAVSEDDYESPPESVDDGANRLVSGAYKLQQRLLLVLDVERVARLDPAGAA